MIACLFLLLIAMGTVPPSQSRAQQSEKAKAPLPSGHAFKLTVVGTTAYVACRGPGSGIKIIDISNPAAPVLKGFHKMATGSFGVAVNGNYAYASAYREGIEVIDVSNPSRPVLKGRYKTAGKTYGIAVSGNTVYVAAHTAGVEIIDVSNPANPSLRGSFKAPKMALNVAVSGNLAAVAGFDEVLYFSMSRTPALPS